MWCVYTVDHNCAHVNYFCGWSSMSYTQSNAQELIERLLSAYGVTTQRALAEALQVPSNNVSAWSQRNSVPGSAIIKCVLDTGVDLNWLVSGKLAKASLSKGKELPSGEVLLKEITSNGGKTVLNRIMDAYGFTLQKQLCELLGISSGTVSTWIRRNYFPGDVVIACALETGVDLQWLATGKGGNKSNIMETKITNGIPHKRILSGEIKEAGFWEIDLDFIPYKFENPELISSNKAAWLVEMDISDISNGLWLVGIDGKYDIYDLAILPGKKLNVTNGGFSFVCDREQLLITGKVIVAFDFLHNEFI